MPSSDYVICIDDKNAYGITKGGVYRVVKSGYNYIRIAGNRGVSKTYRISRFRPVKDNNINKLLYKGL